MSAEAQFSVEICILAGGLSQRMGKDKSKLKFGGHTMLGRIRATAKTLNLPVQLIRRDAVARCGPLGGIYTALKTTKADAVLFLACDMPFVTGSLLRTLLKHFRQPDRALFVQSGRKPGFPLVLHRETLPTVSRQIRQKRFSLQQLAFELRAKFFTPSARQQTQLRNINTPEEWNRAVRFFGRETVPVQRAKASSSPRRC